MSPQTEMDYRSPTCARKKYVKVKNPKSFKREKTLPTQRNENQIYIMFHWQDLDT